jgi:subtilisin family serine protease
MRTRPSRRATAVGALALAAGFVLGAAAPAAAAGDQWWYDAYDVAAAQEEGWTGDGVKVAVIDNQINPDLPVFAGTNLTVDDEALCQGRSPVSSEFSAGAQHGSTVAALLIGNGEGAGGIRGMAPDAEVTFYAIGSEPEGSTTDTCEVPADAPEGLSWLGWGVQRAMDAGAEIISMSVISGSSTVEDQQVIAEAIARGVVLVAGGPNNDEGVDPWSMRGVIAVNAMDAEMNLAIQPGWNIPNETVGTTVVAAGVDVSVLGNDGDWNATENATGTSIATPLVAGILANTAQKYPEATGNQLIQSLIHNTGAEDHELFIDPSDGYGYGLASLGHMLRVDPTQYDDVNPLLEKELSYGLAETPTDEQIAEAQGALASATPSSDGASEEPTPSGGGIMTGIIVAVIVVVVLIVIAVVVTIVIVTRNNRKNRSRSLQ